ncbi:RNA-guided endonuclease TnpB family protein [Dapis sp. BLCC M172]|uniref:RNA-guided endonuclease TnpB family protein n=1 Tax=Dapis sp. BLCC M172 TaxID=2975281 RepID=UPI003CE73FB6
MAILTLTLKLPFYRLNQCKAQEFDRLTELNTSIANQLLEIPKTDRRKFTSKDFNHVEIGSGWINQTIRNACASTKVKKFQFLPLEINNQGWCIQKKGDTYSVAFSIVRGVKKRVPLAIHQSSYAEVLDQIMATEAKKGSLKLWKSKKGIWYVLISVSMDVPEPREIKGWIGVDRGQNRIAVASLPQSFGKFWDGRQIKHLRRHYQRIRKALQKAKKRKVIKRLESKERRIITYINHCISKQLVELASYYQMGLRFEDLSGIRQTSKQSRKAKSDAGNNRDSWAYDQLEQLTRYKAIKAGVIVESIPAPYTSKSDHRNGVLGKRNRHWFRGFDGYNCDADWNASQNIGQWLGFSCPLDLQKAVSVMDGDGLEDGVNGSPLN